MEFIFSANRLDKNWDFIKVGNNYLNYNYNNNCKKREFFIETSGLIILGDTNINFSNAIRSHSNEAAIKRHIKKLTHGFVIVIVKSNNKIIIYNDIFGYYQLFYKNDNNQLIIASDYKLLIESSKGIIDQFALLDLVLFNYTLLDRTLLLDIKRFKGGTKCIVSNGSLSLSFPNNYADNFQLPEKLTSIKPQNVANILKENVNSDLCDERDIYLTMTGGFDSRALLAACNNLGLSFKSFTFGQHGNIEMEVPKPFIEKFSQKHTNFYLDQNYLNKLENIVYDFISYNLDNPTMLDITQYSFIKEQLPTANIISGIMGGEIMGGQSIGAQVTFNNFAANLIRANNPNELRESFYRELENNPFLNKEKIYELEESYLNSLEPYYKQSDNLNLLKFLLNEKYSKFFGTINKVFKNHSNLVIPFLNANYLDTILNSHISFLRKKPFYHNPIINFKFKVFYAKMISFLSPELGETRFDRLYRVNDLCKFYRLPLAGLGYMKSHLFKTNKKNYPKPHHYDLWFKDIIIDIFRQDNKYRDNPILQQYYLTEIKYDKLSTLDKKRLANASAGIIAINKIRENLKK
ncbi:MAG: hypothetical protein ACLFVR_08670 [Thiohalospira sp.]